MMAGKSPLLKLNNGAQMPALGLGVFQSPPDQTVTAVDAALADGYRLIDTAAAYGNEEAVGEAVRSSGVDRADVFVTTKLWISDYGYTEALHGANRSLRKLGMEYVDLFLLHHPLPTEFDRTIAAYKALEKLVADGKIRAIGVSNFSAEDLTKLMAQTNVVPAVNQIEVHPYFVQRELHEFHEGHGIVTQAWSPIGGVNVYWPGNEGRLTSPLEHPAITVLAAKYGKTPAQIILRWHIEHGVSAIPKSVRPARIAENIDIFAFALTPDEVATIDALDTGVRGGPEPATVTPQNYSFTIPD
jgi:diketogulonate reductase-like aldo/keto reductase